MSTLTKEEQDWLKEIKEIAPTCVNGFHIEECIRIIDRLVAENEELREELGKSTLIGVCEVCKEKSVLKADEFRSHFDIRRKG